MVRDRTDDSAEKRGSGLAGSLRDLRRSLSALFDGYRPERHYMRGPGPKWRAKHALPVPAEAGTLGAVPMPA